MKEMGLGKIIQQDIKKALKKQDKPKLAILRFLQAQIQNEEIAQARKKLTDKAIINLIASQIKKLKESLTLFEKGGRKDLISQTKAEIEILQSYLPKQLSDEKLQKEVEKISQQNPSIINQGVLIGLCIKALSGKADNQRIAQMVKNVVK
jgi:uncharacterized protein YqeY